MDKFWANQLTFAVSAFWHGFYPSYYSSFFLGGLLVEAGKDWFRIRVLFRFIPGPMRSVFAQ
jgi:hypothetical protein